MYLQSLIPNIKTFALKQDVTKLFLTDICDIRVVAADIKGSQNFQ